MKYFGFDKENLRVKTLYNDENFFNKQEVEEKKDELIKITDEVHEKLYKEGMYKLKDGIENIEGTIQKCDFDKYFEKYQKTSFDE